MGRQSSLTKYGKRVNGYTSDLGAGLSEHVINQRIADNNFKTTGTNYAAIRYQKNVNELIDVMKNDPGLIHSEEKIIAKYANNPSINILEIYSERRPCKVCEPLVRKYSPHVTYSFSYTPAGKKALQNAINIRCEK